VRLLRPVHEQIYRPPRLTVKGCAVPGFVGFAGGLTEITSADALGVTFLQLRFGPEAIGQTRRFGFDPSRDSRRFTLIFGSIPSTPAATRVGATIPQVG
jgi:hypothetical protein